MRFDLATIGEGQLRLTVPLGERLRNAGSLRVSAAGAEANVAAVLAQLGHRATWASALPQTALGERVVQEYQSTGVDLSAMVRVPEGRVALYFLEPGQSPLPSAVTYDRMHTPFRETGPERYDWDILADTRLLFMTGITAALSPTTQAVLTHARELARARGIGAVVDVNYRRTLWEPDHARSVLAPLIHGAALVFCPCEDAKTVFGVDAEGPEICRALREEYSISDVVSTDQARAVYVSSESLGDHSLPITPVSVVDRPGAGDAFVGATIHGYLSGDLLLGVRYGQRAANLALTHYGDVTRISSGDLECIDNTDIIR